MITLSLPSCTVKNIGNSLKPKTQLFKVIIIVSFQVKHAGVQNQNNGKHATVQILIDCTVTQNTAPANLAQSLFIIRNPRQVTNMLYHL